MKDRTEEFLSLRQITDDEDSIKEEKVDPAVKNFLTDFGEIKLELQRITNRINVIKSFYSRLDKITNSEIRNEVKNKIDTESESVHAEFEVIRKKIKDLCQLTTESELFERIRRSQIQATLDHIKELINEFVISLENEKEKSLKKIETILFITNGAYTENEDELMNLVERGAANLFNNSLLENEEAKRYLQIREEEKDDLLKIEKSLREVRDLFRQMASLTLAQNEQILTLRETTNKSQSRVITAKTELNSAQRYKKSKRTLQLRLGICCSVMLIVCLFITILLYTI